MRSIFGGEDSLGFHGHRECSVQIPSIDFWKTGWKHHQAAPSAPDPHDLGMCTTCRTRRIADKTLAQSTYTRSTSETAPHSEHPVVECALRELMILGRFNNATADLMDPRDSLVLRSIKSDPKLLAPTRRCRIAPSMVGRTAFFEDEG